MAEMIKGKIGIRILIIANFKRYYMMAIDIKQQNLIKVKIQMNLPYGYYKINRKYGFQLDLTINWILLSTRIYFMKQQGIMLIEFLVKQNIGY